MFLCRDLETVRVASDTWFREKAAAGVGIRKRGEDSESDGDQNTAEDRDVRALMDGVGSDSE